MLKLKELLRRWGPALLMMVLIFAFSSRPSTSLPDFSWADKFVKKGGHMLGYGLLSLAYWRGLGMRAGRQPMAWLFAIAYAFTDELHQTLVPGRHPSPVDVLVFDNLGALAGLFAWTYYSRKAAIVSRDEFPHGT